ncbi:hypothetical protein LCGC14_3027700 [marine sediment metagenome]|uniref:Uncharacterized protein n=1 Tax=marine sediment metagenome TaxID=412755 RepID=A0A0F8ZJG8_9ZZZZ
MSKKVMTSKEAWDWVHTGLRLICDSQDQINNVLELTIRDIQEETTEDMREYDRRFGIVEVKGGGI